MTSPRAVPFFMPDGSLTDRFRRPLATREELADVQSGLNNGQSALQTQLVALQAALDDLVLSGAAGYYEHVQSAPAASWAISHSFGRNPVVQVIDTSGALMLTDMDFLPGLVTLTFAVPTAGRALLL